MNETANLARRRAAMMIITGMVIVIGSGAFAWFGGRDYQSPFDGSETRVEGNVAITTHQVPPIFGEGELRATYDLPVRNWWDHPLHITNIVCSCSCSKADLSSRNLPPWGETHLQVEVKLPPVGGERDVSVILETEGGQRLVHGFKAIGYPYVQMVNESSSLSFGEVMPAATWMYRRRST